MTGMDEASNEKSGEKGQVYCTEIKPKTPKRRSKSSSKRQDEKEENGDGATSSFVSGPGSSSIKPSSSKLKGNQCLNPKCTDKNCSLPGSPKIHKIHPKQKSGNSSVTKTTCTDANCSDCDGNHGSAARITFLSIAGILFIAIIGYISFIKMKTKRSRSSIDHF